MTPDHLRLLSLIPRGRARATSMGALAAQMGCSDREVRALIQELVNEHHEPICTLPTGRGVWRAETPEEVTEAAEQLHSRAMSLLERCRALRIAGESIAWKPSLF